MMMMNYSIPLRQRLIKAMLQNPIVLAAPFQTELHQRPLTKTILSPEGYQVDNVQKVALALLLIPAVLCSIGALFSMQWSLFFITLFMLLLVGVIAWILKLRSEMVWIVSWGEDRVEVEDGRYGPVVQWQEPLAAFTGLIRETGWLRRAGKYTLNRPVYGLLLAHPDPSKNILLYANHQKIGEETIAYYEAQLGKRLLG